VAKQQSFADKNKNKSRSEFTFVKCIVSTYDKNTESWKFRDKMVKVKSTAELADMTF